MRRYNNNSGRKYAPHPAAAAVTDKLTMEQQRQQQQGVVHDSSNEQYPRQQQHTYFNHNYNRNQYPDQASNVDRDLYDEKPFALGDSYPQEYLYNPRPSVSMSSFAYATTNSGVDDPLQRWKVIEDGSDSSENRSRKFGLREYQSFVGTDSMTYPSLISTSHPYTAPTRIENRYNPSVVPTIRDNELPIVSPVYDELEQKSLMRNYVTGNPKLGHWTELKPPPLTNDTYATQDAIYDQPKDFYRYSDPHYDNSQVVYSKSIQSRPPSSSSSCRLQHSNLASNTAINHASANTKMIEITPGTFLRLRGADETYHAIRSDSYVPCLCFICASDGNSNNDTDHEPIFCIQDAEYFLCPLCKTVCPLDDGSKKRWLPNESGGGVGLGFTMRTLVQIQNEITRS